MHEPKKGQDKDNMHIAIGFGMTSISIGLVKNGEVISRTRIPVLSQTGLLRRLTLIVDVIYKLLSRSQVTLSECTGLGIATSGVIDEERRTLITINDAYSDAIGFPFVEWFEGAFGLPCILVNDNKAALAGEAAYGVARGETNALLVTIETGIAAAAMLNGHALPGWEFLNMDDLRVCEETYINQPVGSQCGDSLISHWMTYIVNLIQVYAPNIVILSGGFISAQVDLVPLLQEQVSKYAGKPWGNARFVVVEDLDTSILLGVSRLLE